MSSPKCRSDGCPGPKSRMLFYKPVSRVDCMVRMLTTHFFRIWFKLSWSKTIFLPFGKLHVLHTRHLATCDCFSSWRKLLKGPNLSHETALCRMRRSKCTTAQRGVPTMLPTREGTTEELLKSHEEYFERNYCFRPQASNLVFERQGRIPFEHLLCMWLTSKNVDTESNHKSYAK